MRRLHLDALQAVVAKPTQVVMRELVPFAKNYLRNA
jgi:hypothetical protein